MFAPFTITELITKKSLANMNQKGAPGHDLIAIEMLKKLSSRHEILKDLINPCLNIHPSQLIS